MERCKESRQREFFYLAVLLLILAMPGKRASAQDFERYKPKTVPAPRESVPLPDKKEVAVSGSDDVLVPRLDAIVVLDQSDKVAPKHPNPDATDVNFYVANPNSIIYSARARQILQSYIGQPITLRRLNELARQLITFYRDCGQPIVDVQIPEQNITGGTIQLVVVESRVGDVHVHGACYSNECYLRSSIACTRPNTLIRESSLREDLYWLNRSPFRRVGVDFKPGTATGTTDVLYNVEEVRAIRGYLGYEDTGVRSLALERLLAGFIVGNVFGRDGTLGYQYTTDPKFEQLEAHALSFNYDLNRQWSALTYASWASANPDLPPPLNQGGESWQTGAYLSRYLQRSSWAEDSLSMGVDFKSTNNNLEFGGVNVQTSRADLFELNLGYDLLRRYENNDYFRFVNDLYVGPGDGFSTDHTSAAFRTIRADTDPTFWYYRGFMEDRSALPCCMELVTRATGQAASERLLFSETLGFGGADSIRGYDTRIANGDAGWIANVELGPQTRQFTRNCNSHYLRSFAFADFGQAFINQPVVGEDPNQYLASVGVGMRYTVANRLSLRIDYGHAFEDVPGMVTNDRLHIGLVSFHGPRLR